MLFFFKTIVLHIQNTYTFQKIKLKMKRLNFGKIGNNNLANEMKSESAIALSARLDRYCTFHFKTKAAQLAGNPHSLISVIPYYGEVRCVNLYMYILCSNQLVT